MALNTKEITKKNNEVLETTGITYHRLVSPASWGDFTTNRSLYGYEVDRNFYNLKAQDILSATFDQKTSTLIIKRYNDSKICVKITAPGGGGVTEDELQKVKTELIKLIELNTKQLRKEAEQMKTDLTKLIDEKVKNVHCDCDMEMAKMKSDITKAYTAADKKLKAELQAEIDKIAKIDVDKLATKDELNAVKKEITAAYMAADEVINKNINNLQKTVNALRTSVTNLEKSVKTNTTNITVLSGQTQEVKKEAEKNKDNIVKLSGETQEVKQETVKNNNNIVKLSGQTKVLETKIETALYYSGDDVEV